MLPEIHKILFTSDLTEMSRHAFTYAASLAGRYCAEMVFLYVMEDVPRSAKGFLDQEILDEIRRRAADDARSSLVGKRRDMGMIRTGLQRFCEAAMADSDDGVQGGGAGEVVVTEGNVVDAILDTAAKFQCDTIVMGSARQGALADAVLGSVVKGVLRRTDRLVVIAPPPKDRS